jgi:hypothetical protein
MSVDRQFVGRSETIGIFEQVHFKRCTRDLSANLKFYGDEELKRPLIESCSTTTILSVERVASAVQ